MAELAAADDRWRWLWKRLRRIVKRLLKFVGINWSGGFVNGRVMAVGCCVTSNSPIVLTRYVDEQVKGLVEPVSFSDSAARWVESIEFKVHSGHLISIFKWVQRENGGKKEFPRLELCGRRPMAEKACGLRTWLFTQVAGRCRGGEEKMAKCELQLRVVTSFCCTRKLLPSTAVRDGGENEPSGDPNTKASNVSTFSPENSFFQLQSVNWRVGWIWVFCQRFSIPSSGFS